MDHDDTSKTDPDRRPAVPPGVATRCELVAAWKTAYGAPPPKGLSTRLLRYGYAYHQQVQEHGGLSRTRLRELMRYARESEDIKRRQSVSSPSPKLTVGTRLVREWRGRTHVAEVRESGILYNGKTYRSLSQVARGITGTRWSGPRFFGV